MTLPLGLQLAQSGGGTIDEATLARGGDVRGAYLHVPFCFHKCHYCDFYSIVDTQDRQEPFTRRLIAEIEHVAPRFGRPLETIFVGGGTPTLLRVDLWRSLLAALSACVTLADGAEFAVEANPETVTAELADVLRAGGVNRASVGGQSFDRRHLQTLERWHDPENVARAMTLLRGAGITNLNVDLIFGVPGQTLDDWRRDLDTVLALEPAHLSCYGLTYEPNTALTARLRAGSIHRIDEDIEADMFEATIERLAAAGFEHYEISNWARPGRRCRHNLLYWHNASWWAFGPSASGHVGGTRWKNAPHLARYLESGPLPPVIDVEHLDPATRSGERFMLGLRLIEGIERAELDAILADDPQRESRRAAIDKHVQGQLLVLDRTGLRLTRRGLMVADSVIADLV